MAWVLVFVGASIIALALAFAFGAGSGSNTHTRVHAPGADGKLVLKSDTSSTTDSPTSDSIVGTLLVVGALLLLSGAFYSRISKINLPLGGGLELQALATVLPDAAKAVQRQLPDQDLTRRSPGEIAAATQAATTIAAARVLQLRRMTKLDPESAATVAGVSDLAPEDLEAIRHSTSPSPSFWDKLANAALNEVLPPDHS
jgi:hypothetical protein